MGYYTIEQAQEELEWLADKKWWREEQGYIHWMGESPDGNEIIGDDPREIAGRVLKKFKTLRTKIVELTEEVEKLKQENKLRGLEDIFQEMCDICQDQGMHPDEINKVADEWNRTRPWQD